MKRTSGKQKEVWKTGGSVANKRSGIWGTNGKKEEVRKLLMKQEEDPWKTGYQEHTGTSGNREKDFREAGGQEK